MPSVPEKKSVKLVTTDHTVTEQDEWLTVVIFNWKALENNINIK